MWLCACASAYAWPQEINFLLALLSPYRFFGFFCRFSYRRIHAMCELCTDVISSRHELSADTLFCYLTLSGFYFAILQQSFFIPHHLICSYHEALHHTRTKSVSILFSYVLRTKQKNIIRKWKRKTVAHQVPKKANREQKKKIVIIKVAEKLWGSCVCIYGFCAVAYAFRAEKRKSEM